MEAKVGSEIKTIQEKTDDGQEMKDQVGSLASWIDANKEEMRARATAIQYKKEVMIKCRQEEMEAAIHSIWSELEETIKHWVEDVLACVNQRMQASAKNLTRRLMKHRWTYRQ
jgi:hypothetical protein